MCILLKLDYEKFLVSNLFLSRVMEDKPLGGLGKGSVVNLSLSERTRKSTELIYLWPLSKQTKAKAHGWVD